MNQSNMNNIPQALPIPEDSIYLDQELKLSNRELIIKGLQKVLKEKKLDLPLGPALDLSLIQISEPTRTLYIS